MRIWAVKTTGEHSICWFSGTFKHLVKETKTVSHTLVLPKNRKRITISVELNKYSALYVWLINLVFLVPDNIVRWAATVQQSAEVKKACNVIFISSWTFAGCVNERKHTCFGLQAQTAWCSWSAAWHKRQSASLLPRTSGLVWSERSWLIPHLHRLTAAQRWLQACGDVSQDILNLTNTLKC